MLNEKELWGSFPDENQILDDFNTQALFPGLLSKDLRRE